MLDMQPISKSSTMFKDTLQGPYFPAQFAPDVVMAFQYVTRTDGFTKVAHEREGGTIISQPQADTNLALMNRPFAKNSYNYGYLYINSSKAKGIKNADLEKSIKGLISDATLLSKFNSMVKEINKTNQGFSFGTANEHFIWDYNANVLGLKEKASSSD